MRPLRLPGQYFDKETNLAYNLFRDYDPAIGRYLQSDLVGLEGGLNTYAYVDSEPVSYVDDDGLAKQRGGPWKPPSGLKFGCRGTDT